MSTAQTRGNHFNLMRLGFALLVLLSHAPELVDGDRKREILSRIFNTFSFGEFAVNGFFFISGYLITQSWDRTPSMFAFLRKRVLRIYPGFIVASLVSVVLAGYLTGAPGFFSELYVRGLAKDLVTLGPPVTPAVFAGLPYAGAGVNGALWTIQYEFRCYLLVLVLGLAGIIKRRKIVAALLVCSLVLLFVPNLNSVTFPQSKLLLGDPDQLVRFLCFFLAGANGYLFRDRIALRSNVVLFLIPVLGICMSLAPLAVPGMALFGGYILLWFAFRPLPILGQVPLKTDISYGVYLYGWPTQQLLCWYFRGASPWLIFAESVLICSIVGAMSWLLVERPFLRLKSKRKTGAGDPDRVFHTRAAPEVGEPVPGIASGSNIESEVDNSISR